MTDKFMCPSCGWIQTELEEEVERLRALVRTAYWEGAQAASQFGSGKPNWLTADARKALGDACPPRRARRAGGGRSCHCRRGTPRNVIIGQKAARDTASVIRNRHATMVTTGAASTRRKIHDKQHPPIPLPHRIRSPIRRNTLRNKRAGRHPQTSRSASP